MNRWPLPATAASVALALVASGLVLALYALTMPIVLPASGDAMAQIAATLTQPLELNPHHLLVTPADRLALAISARVGYRGPAFIPIQALNSLLGAAACGLFLLWLVRLGVPLPVAFAYALALAATFAHWLHSREAETGILANFFLLLTLNLAARSRSRRRIVLPAIPAALSILCALNCAALMPALALFNTLGTESRARGRTILGFLVASALVTMVALVLVPWIAVGSSPQAVIEKLTTHASTDRLPEQGELTFANVLRAGSGLINAFTGDTAVTTALKARLSGEAPVPVPDLDWMRFALGALLALVVTLPLLARPPGEKERLVWLAAWVALVPVALFNFLWLGSDPQFWLPLLPFLGTWSAVHAVRSTRGWRSGHPAAPGTALAVVAAALALAIANAPTPVPTLLDRNGSQSWQRARLFAERVDPADVLLNVGGWGPYLQALGEARAVSLIYGLPLGKEAYHEALLDTIDRTLETGGRVFALNVFTAADAAATSGWEEIAAISGRSREEWLEELTTRYDVQPMETRVYGDLWRIRARGAQSHGP